jgi:hypothetical protein
VKTAEERHGGGLEDERERTLSAPRRGPQPLSTWSRQDRGGSHHDRGENHYSPIKPRGAGPIQALSEEALEYHRGAKIPLLMGFGECYLEPARIAEGSPIADPLQPQWD